MPKAPDNIMGIRRKKIMQKDGKGMIKAAAFLMVVCGILTMFLAFKTLSRVNKTNDNMVKFESYYQTNLKNNNGTDPSTSLVFQEFKNWYKASTAYDYMQIGLSGLHIILGALTLVIATKSKSNTLLMVFGGILLVMGALIVIYPLIKHKSAYDDLEKGLELITSLIKAFGGSQAADLPFEFDFKMPSLSPWTYVITYSGLGLGLMYMSGVLSSGFGLFKAPAKENNTLAMTGMTGPSDDFFAQFNKPPVPQSAPQPTSVNTAPQGQPRPQGAPQGQPRPQGAPQGQPRPQGAPQGQPRPQGAPQGQPRPQGAPQGQPPPQGAPQGQPTPQGAPQGAPRPQGAPQGQPRPQGAPQGQPRPQGAPQGQPRPQGAPMQGQPRPQVRPAPNVRPAPGVKPKPPVDDDGPTSSGSMDEVALPSAEDLERLLGGMSGQK